MLITLDNFYNIKDYNHFIQNALENNIYFKEYINIKEPHNWIIYLKDEDKPRFIKYKKVEDKYKRFLSKTITPLFENEKILFKRKGGQDINFTHYITPKVFKNEDYILIFISTKNIVRFISKILDLKIYYYTKVDKKSYYAVIGKDSVDILINYFTLNYSNSLVVLVDKKNNYKSVPVFYKTPFDYEIDSKIYLFSKRLVKNKTYELPYYYKGKYYPLSRKLKDD